MTIKEYLNANDILIGQYPTQISFVKLIQSSNLSKIIEDYMVNFAKIKCAEQRQICVDYVEVDYTIISNFIDRGESPIEVYAINSTILNAPEPEM